MYFFLSTYASFSSHLHKKKWEEGLKYFIWTAPWVMASKKENI